MSDRWNDFKTGFDQIQADDALKEHTKAYLAQKTNGYRRGPAVLYRRIAIIACFVMLLLAGGGYSSYFTSACTISVDVNPSIELDVNRYDRVIAVQSFNEDGAALIAAKNLRFLDYREALSELLADDVMEPYLTQDYLIDITVFGTDNNKSGEILENLANDTSDYENVHCTSGNSKDVKEAHAHGMSCGKYQAFLELYALDPSVTAEEVQNLSMKQIRERIRELSGGSSDSTQENSSGTNTNHEEEHHDDEINSETDDSNNKGNSNSNNNGNRNGNGNNGNGNNGNGNNGNDSGHHKNCHGNGHQGGS